MKAKWDVMKNKQLNEKNVYFTYHGYRFIAEWDPKENVFASDTSKYLNVTELPPPLPEPLALDVNATV